MSKKQLTEEEKQRRAETARRNGAKSKGPITPEGKYRSSMNAIATGNHVELHKEDLPPFFFLLSTDDRAAYVRSFQSQLRQFKPNSEFELSLVRRMAVALFQHDRLTNLGAEALQREIDKVVREYPSLGLSEHFFQGLKRAVFEKELQRFVARSQRHTSPPSIASIRHCCRSRSIPPCSQPSRSTSAPTRVRFRKKIRIR